MSGKRRLIFTVPKGPETHYRDIQGGYVGKIWAPLFHAYGYYLPKSAFDDRQSMAQRDKDLTANSYSALQTVIIQNLTLIPLGGKAVLLNLVGSVLWAESESLFAYWDGHVTFGSSHMMAHFCGYSLATILLKKKTRTVWSLPMVAMAVFTFAQYFSWWRRDGFAVCSPLNRMYVDHRTDHLAHVGGIVAGVLTAWLSQR